MAADYDRWNDRARADERGAADEKLIDGLEARGLLSAGMRVLDVGCGTGRMAAAFAARGAEVTALDFSPAMLTRLREALPAGLAGRVRPVEADWEEVDLAARDWKGAFDLALANMTPAIRTPEAFLKLHAASRGGCHYRGWAGRRRDPLLESLWEHVMDSPMPALAGATAGVFAAFNLLYALGCSPSVVFQEVSWERRQPLEKAVAFYTDWFAEAGAPSGDRIASRVAKHLAGIAEDGHVLRRTAGRTGTLTWEVSPT
jgi:SAM-dependent methyltransferase